MNQTPQLSQLQLDSILLQLSRASQLPATSLSPQYNPSISARQSVLSLPSLGGGLPRRPRIYVTERQRFFMFVKVLFKYLAKVKVDSRHVKLIVAKCIQQKLVSHAFLLIRFEEFG